MVTENGERDRKRLRSRYSLQGHEPSVLSPFCFTFTDFTTSHYLGTNPSTHGPLHDISDTIYSKTRYQILKNFIFCSVPDIGSYKDLLLDEEKISPIKSLVISACSRNVFESPTVHLPFIFFWGDKGV
jgi:hypothetical protein